MSNPLRSIDPEKLIGLRANLYYNNKGCQFQLGSVIFEVIEDESDGYRSYYRELQILDTEAPKKQGDLLGSVTLQKGDYDRFEGYKIIDDSDGHMWIEFGTNNTDDYYPNFVFANYPRINTPVKVHVPF